MRNLLIAVCLLLASNEVSALEAQGTARFKNQSLLNSYVAAHFKCNKKGLWADLDTLRVIEVTTSRYTIAGGKRKITDYHTRVKFTCTTVYKARPEVNL